MSQSPNNSNEKWAHSPRIPFLRELTPVLRSASPESSITTETVPKPPVNPRHDALLRLVEVVGTLRKHDGEQSSPCVENDRVLMYYPVDRDVGHANLLVSMNGTGREAQYDSPPHSPPECG